MENVANSSKLRRNQVFRRRPAIVLLDKDTHELIREFRHLEEVI
jgi:hypothetical protein